MPVTPPIAPDDASEALQRIYGRIADTIGGGSVPLGYQMMAHTEAYVQDSFMNMRKFIKDGAGKLEPKTREAIALATSSAMNCKSCVRAHAAECKEAGWTDEQVAEILAVTATCTMYNTYYKFRDLAADEAFEGYSIQLRAHTFMKNSLGPELTELINVVVSSINNCPMCTAGHVKKALDLGLSREDVDEAVRISAVMSSFNVYHRTQ